MKNRLFFSLLSAVLIVLPTLAHADETQFNVLRAYKLANGRGVAVAIPGGWRELSKTRVLEAGAGARFLDPSGRPVEISAAALERASATRSVVWSQDYIKASVAAH